LRQLSSWTHHRLLGRSCVIAGPRCFMETKSEVLNRILLELPGLVQSNLVENTKFIRFTVRLHIDPLDNHRQPEIFILFTHHDLEQARGTHDGLELAFRRNIRQHSFKDEINGKGYCECSTRAVIYGSETARPSQPNLLCTGQKTMPAGRTDATCETRTGPRIATT
jgi:hypothetical protein